MDILLIEDDRRIADFVQRGLRAEGMRVTVSREGGEGLVLAHQAWQDFASGGPSTTRNSDPSSGCGPFQICEMLR